MTATAKPKRTATSASGDDGGEAVPARRAKPAATTLTPRVLRLTRSRFPASSRTKTNPTRMSPKSSPARFAPTSRQAASGGHAVVDVVAGAGGVGGPEKGLAGRRSTEF